jgi:hypothetical protein
VPSAAPTPLTPAELALLVAIRRADEDEGGLSLDDMDDDEKEALGRLVARGLAETITDDEEGAAWARITWRGAEVVRDLGPIDD